MQQRLQSPRVSRSLRTLLLSTTLLIGAAGLLGSGCGGIGNDSIIKYTHKTQPLPPTEAPTDGSYGLFSITDVEAQGKYQLQKGERIGFLERGGKTYAVAGDKEFPIETSMVNRAYYWRKVK